MIRTGATLGGSCQAVVVVTRDVYHIEKKLENLDRARENGAREVLRFFIF
jgi:hypothetical protein